MNIEKPIAYLLMLSASFFTSCLSGLEPLPTEVEDLSMSLSVPIGKVDVGEPETYHVGPPNYYLDQNVPDWAKYETIYYTNTLAVDLTEVYNNSSEINYLAFNINIWNEFSTGCTIYLQFADNAYATLYSFDPIAVEAGRIVQNNVIYPGYSKTTAVLNKEEIKNLKTVEYLIVHIKIDLKHIRSTYDFQYWDSFKLSCQVGARVDFIINNL